MYLSDQRSLCLHTFRLSNDDNNSWHLEMAVEHEFSLQEMRQQK